MADTLHEYGYGQFLYGFDEKPEQDTKTEPNDNAGKYGNAKKCGCAGKFGHSMKCGRTGQFDYSGK